MQLNSYYSPLTMLTVVSQSSKLVAEVELPHWNERDIKSMTTDREIVWQAFAETETAAFDGPARDITIHLPEGYDDCDERYPVFYFHDNSSFDDVHDTLVAEGLIRPAIAVSVPSPDRTFDYTMSDSRANNRTGGCETYGRFLTERLKPAIDEQFRTLAGPEDTGVIGCSLGGLISCWLAWRYPDVFGMAGCMSPSLWWNDRQMLSLLQEKLPTTPHRPAFWFCAGAFETTMWHNALAAAKILKRAGWSEGIDLAWVHDPQGYHDSYYWLKRQRDMLGFFLGKSPASASEISIHKNRELGDLHLDNPAEARGAHLFAKVQYGKEFTISAIDPNWSSDDADIISICPDGKIRPALVGKTIIRANLGQLTAELSCESLARPGSMNYLTLR